MLSGKQRHLTLMRLSRKDHNNFKILTYIHPTASLEISHNHLAWPPMLNKALCGSSRPAGVVALSRKSISGSLRCPACCKPRRHVLFGLLCHKKKVSVCDGGVLRL